MSKPKKRRHGAVSRWLGRLERKERVRPSDRPAPWQAAHDLAVQIEQNNERARLEDLRAGRRYPG
jgi:hypothetical protein